MAPILGVTTVLSSIFLDVNAIESAATKDSSFCQRIAFNCEQVCKGIKSRPILKTVGYCMISGFLIPTFDEYMYVYLLVQLKFEKSIVAWLRLASWLGVILGVIIYVTLLKEKPFALAVGISLVVFCITTIGEVLFTKEIYLGLDPKWFFAIHSLFDAVVFKALVSMPLLSLFAKVVPESIESSIFALLMGLLNLSFGVFGKIIGNLINRMFFKVDKANLTDLWKLYVVQAVCCLLPLAFIWILPSREEVIECQEKLK